VVVIGRSDLTQKGGFAAAGNLAPSVNGFVQFRLPVLEDDQLTYTITGVGTAPFSPYVMLSSSSMAAIDFQASGPSVSFTVNHRAADAVLTVTSPENMARQALERTPITSGGFSLSVKVDTSDTPILYPPTRGCAVTDCAGKNIRYNQCCDSATPFCTVFTLKNVASPTYLTGMAFRSDDPASSANALKAMCSAACQPGDMQCGPAGLSVQTCDPTGSGFADSEKCHVEASAIRSTICTPSSAFGAPLQCLAVEVDTRDGCAFGYTVSGDCEIQPSTICISNGITSGARLPAASQGCQANTTNFGQTCDQRLVCVPNL
jgi:hypothetical protein